HETRMQQLGEGPSTSVGEVFERALELRLVGGRLPLEKAKHRSVGLLQRKEAVEGRHHHPPWITVTSQYFPGQVLDRVKLSLCERVTETTLVAEVAVEDRLCAPRPHRGRVPSFVRGLPLGVPRAPVEPPLPPPGA